KSSGTMTAPEQLRAEFEAKVAVIADPVYRKALSNVSQAGQTLISVTTSRAWSRLTRAGGVASSLASKLYKVVPATVGFVQRVMLRGIGGGPNSTGNGGTPATTVGAPNGPGRGGT